MEFKKVKGRVLLVEEPPKDLVSAGGIIIPDGAESSVEMIKNWLCLVVGVGDSCHEDYEVGQVVVIDPSLQYVGYTDPDNKRSRMFIPQDRVLAIYK
jgi:hypothetical protein